MQDENQKAPDDLDESIKATTVPPNPDQPPPTRELDPLDPDPATGVPYNDLGEPLNTAPLEASNEEKVLANMSHPEVQGAPSEPEDPMRNEHAHRRNRHAERVQGAPSSDTLAKAEEEKHHHRPLHPRTIAEQEAGKAALARLTPGGEPAPVEPAPDEDDL